MSDLHWFKFFTSDWRGSKPVQRMTPIQRGYYIQLLVWAWDETPRGSLPIDNDEVAWMAGAKGHQDFLDNGGLFVLAQFVERDGRMWNEKLEKLAIEAAGKSEKARSAANKKWHNTKDADVKPAQSVRNADAELTQAKRNAIPDARSQKLEPEEKQKPLAAVAAVSPKPSPKPEPPEPSQHATLRQMAQDKWLHHNPEVPTCPWGPAEGNQLKLLIGKTPRWPTSQYAQCMENLFDSDGFSVSTPPAEWLVKLPKYLKGPLNEYGKSQTRRLSKADERLERIHEANRQVIGEVIRDAELYGSNAEAGIVSSGEKVLAVGPRELSRRNS